MIQLERLDALILARLSPKTKKPPTRANVVESLAPYGTDQVSAKEWGEVVAAGIHRLRENHEIDENKLVLTEAGSARLAGLLGVGKVPSTKKWGEFKSKHLRRLIGVSPTLEPESLPRMVVAQRLMLNPDCARSQAKLGDAWLAAKLGISTKRLTLKAVRALLLAREFSLSERLNEENVQRILAAKFAGAKSGVPQDVVHALANRWLEGSPESTPGVERSPKHPQRDAAPRPLVEAGTPSIEKLREALRSPATRRFGNKVFIGSVWQSLQGDPEFQSLGEAGFKSWLINAHRRGDLVLSRADLTSAMDPTEIAASETTYLNSTYHFIQASGEST